MIPGASLARSFRLSLRALGPGGATTIRGSRSPRRRRGPEEELACVIGEKARLDLAAPGERAGEGHLVGVLDVAAHGHAESQSGDPDPPGLEHPG